MKFTKPFLTFCGLAALAGSGCSLPHNQCNDGQCNGAARHRPLISPHSNVLPPSAMLMHPGPGVDGPGPGVFMTGYAGAPAPFPAPVAQVGFLGPDGMTVNWEVSAPRIFDSEPLITPGRFNFPQGAIYRLKLTTIPGRPGVELYPTLEVGPATPRTAAYLAHNNIPFQLTDEDFDQVLTGNFVTKVIYLPDPEFQELAIAGVAELVSTRLDPGIDPIVEADRRGSILAIIRIGNMDLEIPTPTGEGYETGDIVPTAYGGNAYIGAPLPCGPAGCGLENGQYGAQPQGGPNGYIAGVTAPTYGMPMSGTPIGLPGPPHIPLGVPAGLQRHVIQNHTHMHIPGPVEQVGVHVQQKPGLSYPKPVNKVHITEQSYPPHVNYTQPAEEKYQYAPGSGGDCGPNGCDPQGGY